jgi:DNA-binding MarR family transcriptional regulator
VFDWLKRRRLSEEGRRRLLVSLAKAEEAVLETHVRNALEVIATVGDELPLDRVLELYLEALEPVDGRKDIIVRRVLARLEGEDEDGDKGALVARRHRRTFRD